jgi:UDP-glucuronate 4-epimerase
MVTGCAGFIGSHLTEALLRDGVNVVGIDCFNDNYARPEKLRNLERAREWEAFDFVPVDLARGNLDDLLEGCDKVFHLAAEPGVRTSWGSRFEWYVRNNIIATQHLLESVAKRPEVRFVYASSSSIYGEAEALPTREDAAPRPFSPYGVTKLAGENLCSAYHANLGIDVVRLRYFSVYGPRQRPDMAFSVVCRRVLRGEPVELFGGDQTRDFTFVADVVDATRAAATSPEVGGAVFNIGGGSRVSLATALDLLGEISGTPIEVHHSEHQHGDVRDTAADISAARNVLAYSPSVPLEQGLAWQWEWAVEAMGSGQPVAG